MITLAKAGTVNLARNCYFLAIKNNFGLFCFISFGWEQGANINLFSAILCNPFGLM